jgi:hypothetical protein
VTDDLPGALADLEQAEAVAVQYALLAEQGPNSFPARQFMFSARGYRGLPAGTWDRPGISEECRRGRA